MSLRRISTVEDLHAYLHVAMILEHATIPPYLTALYSIHPQTNADAYRIIRVVVIEEMLHLTLAANVLNAVGGTPDLTAEGFVPTYPAHLPNGETDFEVGTQRFSPEAIETFLRIERPAELEGDDRFIDRIRSARALVPAYTDEDDKDLHFYSIGEFYAEIDAGIHRLHEEMGDALFSGDPARQFTPDYFYSGGGELIAVTDLASADAAIDLISEQGEGLGGAIYDNEGELSHFFRFEQLLLGRYYRPGDQAGSPSGPAFEVDWDAVYPVKANAGLEDYPPGSELREAVDHFGQEYGAFLRLVTDSFNGQPKLLEPAIGEMFRLKELILQIMRNPIPGQDGVNGAPVFPTHVAAEVVSS